MIPNIIQIDGERKARDNEGQIEGDDEGRKKVRKTTDKNITE